MNRRDSLKTPAVAAVPAVNLTPAGEGAVVTKPVPNKWRGNWIWLESHFGSAYPRINQAHARNSYFYVRKTFELPSTPSSAVVRASADSRYTLFVNGERVGFGPARCDPRWQCFDGRTLNLIAQSQTGDGLTYGGYPTAIDFRLPSFTLLWVMTIWDYYWHTADVTFLHALYPKVRNAMAFFEKWVNEDGLIANLQDHYWVFIDWTAMDSRGSTTPLNSFYVGTLEAAAKIADAAGFPNDATNYRKLAERTRRALRKLLWVPEKKVFADCRTSDGLSKAVSQPANALAVLFGIVPEGTERTVLENVRAQQGYYFTRVPQGQEI